MSADLPPKLKTLDEVTRLVNDAVAKVLRADDNEAHYGVVCIVLDQTKQRSAQWPVPLVTKFTLSVVPVLDNPVYLTDLVRIALSRMDRELPTPVVQNRARALIEPSDGFDPVCWFTYDGVP